MNSVVTGRGWKSWIDPWLLLTAIITVACAILLGRSSWPVTHWSLDALKNGSPEATEPLTRAIRFQVALMGIGFVALMASAIRVSRRKNALPFSFLHAAPCVYLLLKATLVLNCWIALALVKHEVTNGGPFGKDPWWVNSSLGMDLLRVRVQAARVGDLHDRVDPAIVLKGCLILEVRIFDDGGGGMDLSSALGADADGMQATVVADGLVLHRIPWPEGFSPEGDDGMVTRAGRSTALLTFEAPPASAVDLELHVPGIFEKRKLAIPPVRR